MNTDIEYLSTLERDLADVAAREGLLGTAAPRRRRRISLGGIAAAAVPLLVVAGLIGWLATSGSVNDNAKSAASSNEAAGTAGGGVAFAATEPSASPAQAHTAARSPFDASGDLTKIVRDGSISIEVPRDDFTKGFDAVTRIADANGGFVLSSQTRGQRAGRLTLRIPAKRFDRAMLALRGIGLVQAQSITGRDVTAQFVDLHARLLNLIGQRTVLRNLMTRATTIAETITVESHLQGVQLQIEQIQGQLNLLANQVAQATVRIDLHEKQTPRPSPAPSVRNPSLGSAWHHAVQGFLNVVSAVVVGLGYLVPILVLALAGWLVALAVRRRRRLAG